jgi:hypothetical protein
MGMILLLAFCEPRADVRLGVGAVDDDEVQVGSVCWAYDRRLWD